MTKGKRVVAILLAAAVSLGLASVVGGPAASATTQNTYKVITWQMPSWNGSQSPTWPQSYVGAVEVHSTEGALAQGVLPDCGFFQQDVYRYTEQSDRAKVDTLIGGGVLYGPGNPAEPLIDGGWGKAYRLVNQGECPEVEPSAVVDIFPGDCDNPYTLVQVVNTTETKGEVPAIRYVVRKDGEKFRYGELSDPRYRTFSFRTQMNQRDRFNVRVFAGGEKLAGKTARTVRHDCAPPAVKKPRVTFNGPCGDPWYSVTFDNSRSNRAVTFTWYFTEYPNGNRETVTRTVKAGKVVTTNYRHVTGSTKMRVKAAGKVWKRVSAPSGTYGPCTFGGSQP